LSLSLSLSFLLGFVIEIYFFTFKASATLSTCLSVILKLVVFQDGEAILDGVIEDVLDLELVFVIGVTLAQVPELFCLIETPLQVLRRHEIFSNLDAVMDVTNL